MRFEAKVNLLLDKFGIEHDTPSDEVWDYLIRGMKINAIKAFRDQSPGVGLKAAEDAVETIEAQIKTESFR